LTSPAYTEADIPELNGKVAMVTGATSGIGRASVAILYKKGATVIATARSVQKAQNSTRETINEFNTTTSIVGKRTGFVYSEGKTELVKFEKERFVNMLLDLSSFESIHRFAKAFRAKGLKLDILILNAGMMHPEYATTVDGFESHFGINYLGHFLLVKLLLPVLLESNTRIVIMTSSSHHSSYMPEGIRFNQLDNQIDYDYTAAYAQSKLALLCFGYRLADELKSLRDLISDPKDAINSDAQIMDGSGPGGSQRRREPGVTVNMVHPGLVKTNLRSIMYEYYQNHWFYQFLGFFFTAVDKAAMTPKQAALTPVSSICTITITALHSFHRIVFHTLYIFACFVAFCCDIATHSLPLWCVFYTY